MNESANGGAWVLYHADCLDGFGAAWAAWRRFGDTAHYLPVRHGEPLPALPPGVMLYILDFCYPPAILCEAARRAARIVVLDHHASAQAAFEHHMTQHGRLPERLTARFDQMHSGCVLSWKHFHGTAALPPLLAHIEDRDLWRHHLPGTREINLALFLRLPMPFAEVERLSLAGLRREGKVLRRQQQQSVRRLAQARHRMTLFGVDGLAVNAPPQFASELGETLALQSGTFGLIYHFQGQRNRWECSLRSRGDFDVAGLAVRLGGGGHRNAAGFTLDAQQTPWLGRLANGAPVAA